MEGATNVMADFLSGVGTFFTTAIDWLGTVLNTVVSNPPLLILVLAMPIIGFSVGLLKRLIHM
ncbi:MAG: hypothetical protein E7549_01150 [Ruminococcaceae bacterium]|nr:hypothetical protein [Oscillospiraceae bacterium]